ncbi:MAG: glutamate--cysteine ligase, partial [Promethearchaeota archaeon]
MSLQVYQLIEEHKAKIKQWIHEKKKSLNNSQLPIYSSFDLRDNGYKAAIVDSNLFPAGFNNLDINAQKRAVEAFSTYIPTVFSGKQILIIPEMHTRNLYYLRNLKIIQSLLYRAGYKAIIGSLRKDIIDDRIELKDSKGENLILEKLFRNGKK